MVVVLKLFFPIIVLLVFKSSCYQAENAVVSKVKLRKKDYVKTYNTDEI